ncbi:MAG TPA: hypothetical protein VLY04_23695 [Bryobacteraceae bacterium]|nr:hypothetical protein [Bryobacteraceae bacterium]
MQMILVYPSGRRADAVLLSVGKSKMRIAIKGHTDVVELRQVDGEWMTERGLVVQFDAITTDGPNDAARFCSQLPAPARAAGA